MLSGDGDSTAKAQDERFAFCMCTYISCAEAIDLVGNNPLLKNVFTSKNDQI